ncbi:MAG: OmpA family protein [Elusimicrobia bacterium]|nr:OmpA family protein [Elusimicrobiota bacterium]
MSLLLALALLCAPARAQDSVDADEPWSEERFSVEELRADRELAAIQKRIDSGDLPKVQFDFDSADIRPESYAVLNMVADVLLKNPRVKLRVWAHTCIIGTREYNLELSQARAKSVKSYLVQQGVPPPSIRFHGWGPDRPIADNSTEEGRQKNRRVEFRVVRGDWGSIY